MLFLGRRIPSWLRFYVAGDKALTKVLVNLFLSSPIIFVQIR